jgi:predicted DNA-binding transcriptional regulator YafY
MTAAQLAEELEVSVRTVYRDIDALHRAGVPLYGQPGHFGGFRLVDGYRTRLTGLSTDEAEALFVATAPGLAAQLGFGPALAVAQRKLRAALPAEVSAQAEKTGARFHLDALGWYATANDVPFLLDCARAVQGGRALEIRYRRRKEPTDIDRRIQPYGLVLKAGCWYLVAGPGPRTYRVDQILQLVVRDEIASPPSDFDLATYWSQSQADFLRSSNERTATAVVGTSRPRATSGST